jgi:hypothetical protein
MLLFSYSNSDSSLTSTISGVSLRIFLGLDIIKVKYITTKRMMRIIFVK